jgi:transcriptional regulator with XRE-family HTH domain
MTVGDKIKKLRQRKVMGQAELALAAGVAVNTLWRIEADKVAARPATLRRLATALGIEPGELVVDTSRAG